VSGFNIRGRRYENVVYDLLKEYFDEVFIHIEKPTKQETSGEYNSKDRYDFYVYAKPNNFAVDVFGTNATRGVVNIMNMKETKYRKISSNEPLYFVYFGNSIDENKIGYWMATRKNKFPANWKIIDINQFRDELGSYSSFEVI
jgi:hypothetical protein